MLDELCVVVLELDVVSLCELEVCVLVVEELDEVSIGAVDVWDVLVVVEEEPVVELVDSLELVEDPVLVLDAVVVLELVLLVLVVSRIVSVLVRLLVIDVVDAASVLAGPPFALGDSWDPAASEGAGAPIPATVIPPPVSSESATRLTHAGALTRPPLPTAASPCARARRAAPLLSPDHPSGNGSTSG